MHWQLQEAKNKLSQVVKFAKEEPQIITLHGKETVVVISIKEYKKLYQQQQKPSLLNMMQNSPWAACDLDVSRSQDTGRAFDL